jgi:glycosyltransferase involved in cell wall biosynthesis
VRLRGWTSALQEEMAKASLFVLSSRAEGYPRVILEAMACGLPVVSADCPSGPREMITSGVDGVLVPNEDPRALTVAISDMIRSGPEARRALGAAGLRRVEELDQREVARRWERLLSRLERRRGLQERKNP